MGSADIVITFSFKDFFEAFLCSAKFSIIFYSHLSFYADMFDNDHGLAVIVK